MAADGQIYFQKRTIPSSGSQKFTFFLARIRRLARPNLCVKVLKLRGWVRILWFNEFQKTL